MKKHLEFVFGSIIMFMMIAVFWQFLDRGAVDQDPVTAGEQPGEQVPLPEDFPVPSPEEGEGVPIPAPLPPEVTEEVPPVACTMDAKMCPDGSYVGRVGPNCEFAACPEEVSGSPEVQYCGPRPTELGACIALFEPVCAQVQVECVTTPCDPVSQTFGNSCEACSNSRVLSYVAGECL